jgi:hypothetical protein
VIFGIVIIVKVNLNGYDLNRLPQNVWLGTIQFSRFGEVFYPHADIVSKKKLFLYTFQKIIDYIFLILYNIFWYFAYQYFLMIFSAIKVVSLIALVIFFLLYTTYYV